MKYNEELVQQLRDGEIALKNGFNKKTNELVDYCFPKDGHKASRWREAKLIISCETNQDQWEWDNISDLPTKTIEDFIVSDLDNFNDAIVLWGELFGTKKTPLPTTKAEANELIKVLQALEFPKPTKLTEITIQEFTEDEITLIKLIRMRDEWREGWKPNDNDAGYDICLNEYYRFNIYSNESVSLSLFSFETEETAKDFMETFEKELNQVKHLIA